MVERSGHHRSSVFLGELGAPRSARDRIPCSAGSRHGTHPRPAQHGGLRRHRTRTHSIRGCCGMSAASRLRELAKRIVFGPVSFAQQHPIGLYDPQQEVAVRLHGRDAARDVTNNHMMACGAPFTIGIGLEKAESAATAEQQLLSLRFYGRAAGDKLLGSMALRPSAVIPFGNRNLHLFHALNYENFCLPSPGSGRATSTTPTCDRGLPRRTFASPSANCTPCLFSTFVPGRWCSAACPMERAATSTP
jgi:hypothetical protein